MFPYGVKGMQSTPLRIGLQWLQVPPSALLHHQVAGLLELHQPRMRKLLTPLTPLARRLWQKALQSGVHPTYHSDRLNTLPSCNRTQTSHDMPHTHSIQQEGLFCSL